MSIKQEEYSFYYKVKNESARKRLGFKAGFFWCTAKKQSLALSRGELAMDAAGFDEADFARPVRVHFPVENDIPPEGVFDTKFCENREPGGEDGKTLTLIPGAASAVKSDETELADGAGTPAGENGIQETHNPPANPQLTVVATLPFRHRVLAQYIGDGEYLYHVDTGQKKEIACLEMDTQNTTVQNLILAAENVEPFKKAIEHDIHKAVNAYKQVFPVDGKVPELCTTIKFFKEWFSAEHINRGLLIKEWAERLKNKPAPVKKTGPHKVIVDDVNKPERPRRSEKPTHRTINYELACGFCEELDLNNLRPAMDFAKRIIAEDREDWKQMSMTVGIIPDIKGYDRQTIIDLVRKAPKAVHNGNPDLRRTWCESFLAVHGVRDPDWYEYVPDNTPTTHEENAARLRQAGKCLRDIEAGRFQCDEEKPQPTGELADEPATPEAVEQDTTEHHPDPQPLENEPPVSQTEAGYQKIRAELHEARKNIPPKNPVDFGKQLAAARGEYVEGISDPNDPKWVRDDYSASNQGEKTENPLPPTDAVTATAMEGEFIPTQEWPEYFEPGRYEGVPNDVYHSANGISSTMVKDARISLMYYHGRHVTRVIPRQDSQAFILGRIIHSFVLEPEKFTTEYAVPAEMPKSVVSTTSDMVALIKEYNATLPALMTPDELKAWIERYNSSLIPPLSLSGSAEEIANLYMSLPGEFQRIPDDVKATATAMKSCIKEYNISLPPMLKTSGTRDQLLDQIATVRPEFAEQERAKFIPYNVSGTKEQLTEIVRTIRPDVVLADDWHRQQEEASQGRTMISLEMSGLVKNINDALQADEDAARLLNHPERKSEVSYFGFDEETGLEVRVRPDIEIRLPSPLDSICADLKTVSMGYVPQDRLKARLHREIIERGYHISAAMYCDVAALDTFAWIFVNKDPGYHWVAVVWAPAEMLELGRQEYRRLLRQINEATFSGYWPAPVAGQYVDELNDYDISRLDALNKMSQEDFA
ncbi:DNA breaking-rejoining protein [Salmonella enterica subsp. enterica serovar Typhimurium]|uniref:DNA breaking-rejoining protein n=1 Tax=Salmonella anatum TaxID=58712 RepID=A0A5X8E9Z8_SALAN|nr:DNA breaking-rejoining protein [Salmonella enterica subsp. enterica serovar Typhimurium]ECA9356645.1 DNA breaking-rejoining protein [Salmonella enterica subsp. enterica serovar Anatum]EKN5321761.1 PD-(D/E)XK nuclease-like domain-containing protein [Salmonella enterica]ECN0548559.1 DNA breaking-rejoining protein [Salmonella enterica subsp. enterica serovar Typhimurium]ECN6781282.1 DNA breaking-rejoining protein [Salmonella enterica subsp. enterica serovar Typhimurium]